MKEIEEEKKAILVVGEEKLAYSITVCLLEKGHQVTLCSQKRLDALKCINTHFLDLYNRPFDVLAEKNFYIIDHIESEMDFTLSIVITKEKLAHKKLHIQKLEDVLPREALIVINTESISLSAIQKDAIQPERVIGANWAEPAHTTQFLEIITNEKSSIELVQNFCSTAESLWGKDPYILNRGKGIRSRLMSALVREAFYLVENGYVAVEDIDRACRNDAGYYLPFAGNCRYMDLMGTYVYGEVMKDLNPELCKDRNVPSFFEEIIMKGGKGTENEKGFYIYEEGEVERKKEMFRKFSYQIQEVIAKYPFTMKKASVLENNK